MIPSAPDNIASALMMIAKQARNEMFLADEDIAFIRDVVGSAQDYELSELVNDENRDDIRRELCLLLSTPDANAVADVLYEYQDVVFTVIPELRQSAGYVQGNRNHTEDLWTHLVETVRYIGKPEAAFRLEALLHDAGKPFCQEFDENGNATYFGHMEVSAEIVETVMTRFGFDEPTIARCCYIASVHDYKLKDYDDSIRWFRARYGSDFELRDDLLAHMEADVLGRGEMTDHVRQYRERFIRAREMVLALDAADVEALGHSSIERVVLAIDTPALDEAGFREHGDDYLTVLNRCLSDVLDGKCENDRDALIERAGYRFEKLSRKNR